MNQTKLTPTEQAYYAALFAEYGGVDNTQPKPKPKRWWTDSDGVTHIGQPRPEPKPVKRPKAKQLSFDF